MAKLCYEVIEKAGLKVEDFAYAGIATPGIADNERGMVVYANNLHFQNFPIADILKSYIPFRKVLIANDANAAAMGEAVAGCAKGIANSVFITLGTGVGGGVIIDHKIYAGFNCAGAELGHEVIRHNGRPCSCGRKGCWEAYSSATALIKYTKEVMRKHKDSSMWKDVDGEISRVDGRTAFEASKQGDAAAKKVVDWYIDYLACGLINMINIFQPEVLCIGGGICGQGDYLLNPLKAKVASAQYGEGGIPQTELKIAELGNDAGIIGAAVLGVEF
jgi:glucokinase